jgi:hypothetical protein
VSVAGRRSASTSQERAGSVITACAAAVAAGLAAYQLTRPGLLAGATPDIAAWFGGSVRLVHGAMPYRDFVLTQPPGFALLASPLAFLSEAIGTRDALAVLRSLTPLLAAATVVLVGRMVRHRGPGAVLVACGFMAVFPAELYSLRSGLLESVVALLSLAALSLAFRGDELREGGRLAAAGALLGLAVAVKASAILPALVLIAVCAGSGRRRALRAGAGAAFGFGVPTLPFFLAAPGDFVRDAVVTQLGRVPAPDRVPLLPRLGDLTGASAFGAGRVAVVATAAALAALVAMGFVSGRARTASAAAGRGPRPLEWFALVATVLVAVAQLGPSRYYPHYAALVVPFLALLLGVSVSRLQRGLGVPATALAVAWVVALLANQADGISQETAPDLARAVDMIVPPGACVLSDAPRDLVSTDRFVSTLPGCTTMTDPQGATLAYAGEAGAGSRMWQTAFSRADYLVSGRPVSAWDIPDDPRLQAYVNAHFHALRSGALLVYVRAGCSSWLASACTRRSQELRTP